MGWPMLNNHLWLATPDNGLAAVIYAPCEVTAKVADGTEVTIIEDTDYPFRDTINFTIKTPQPVAFPIQLRIPAWADKAELLVNGEPARTRPDNLEIKAGTFVHLTGHWKDGDKITLKLPMNIRITHWECSSIGIERGPLAYGIAPPEDWRKFPDWRRGDALDGWAAWEVHPDGRWEYAVELDTKSPQNSVEVIERDMHAQPWTYQNAPVALRMKARHVRGWGHDEYGNAAPPPISPVKTDTQLETIELRPYGCIRLRVAYIPVLADDQ
jgi:hypothetical protein